MQSLTLRRFDPKVILIDGRSLANYMIDFDIGVAKAMTYDNKRIDSDYFAED
jgi:restriction system protein